VPELQQRVLDNLVSDVLLASVLFLVSAYGLYRLAKIWKVSFLPLAVLLPSFVSAGLMLYVPLSPLYVRSDGEFYQRWGYSLAASWVTGEPADHAETLWPGKGLWPIIIGTFTALAGPITITLVVFNALILVLIVIVLQKATFLLGERAPRWTMVIVFLSSSPFLLWGPSILREALFWLGVALGVLALTYASVHRYRSALPAAILSSLVLLGIRPDAGMFFIYGFVAMLIFLWGIVGLERSQLKVVATVVTLVSLAVSFPTAFEFARGAEVAELSGARILKTNVVNARDSQVTAFGSFAESSESSESLCNSEFVLMPAWTAVLCAAVANLPHALFGPFHWEYGPGAIWWIAGAATLHFLLLVGLAIFHLANSKGRRWPLLALLAVAAASMLMFSSVLSNYGVLIRFRAATEIVLIPLSLCGALALISRVKSWRKRKFSHLPPGAM